jgi:hypothetical protein
VSPAEVALVFRLVRGYWPTPELQEDEAIVWRHILEPLEPMLAAEIIEKLAGEGEMFRPGAGVFKSRYMEALRHRELTTPGAELPSGERVASAEFSRARVAEIRAAFQLDAAVERTASTIETRSAATTVYGYVNDLEPDVERVDAAAHQAGDAEGTADAQF